jgi:peptide/nickel transport system substrate-binding protein
MGLATHPPGFDPHRYWNSATYTVTANVFDTLVDIHPHDGTLAPRLLVELPDPSNRRLALRLRRDVRFHHGRTLDAHDVAASLARLCDPRVHCEASALFQCLPITGMGAHLNDPRTPLRGIHVVDEATVQVELDRPDPTLLTLLSYPASAIAPRELVSDDPDEFAARPVGSGPFRVHSASTARVELVREPQEHHHASRGVDHIDLRFDATQDSSIAAILAKTQDLMYEPLAPACAAALAAGANGARLVATEEDTCFALVLRTTHPELSSPRTRRAIAHAIDRFELATAVAGMPATGGIFSPLSPFHSAGIGIPYDPAAARRLLGSDRGLRLDLHTNDQTPERELAPVLRDQLARVGIDVTLEVTTYNEKVEREVHGAPALAAVDWHLSIGFGSYLVDPAFTTIGLRHGSCNGARWATPELDELAAQGHAMLSETRLRACREVDRLVTREAVWIPLVYPRRVDLVGRRLAEYRQPRYPSPLVRRFESEQLTRTPIREGAGA